MLEPSEFEEVTCIKMSLEAGGKPVYWVAAFLVDGLLVDTGCSHTAGEIVEYLRDRRVDLVVNTHFHEDHVGGDRAVMEAFGVPAYAHRDSVTAIAAVPELNPYQEFVWGYPDPAEVMELGSVVETDRFRFEVVPTEGHSKGHVALFEPTRGWLFSGDIFITEHPKVIRADENAWGLARTMKVLAGLPSERLVLFTSMGKVIPDGRASLDECRRYLEETGDRARSMSDRGMSPEEVRQELFGPGSSLAGVTGGHFSTDNLITSLLEDIR